MPTRLMPILLSGAAAIVVMSWIVPSPWPGNASVPPEASIKHGRGQITQEVSSAPAFTAWALRGHELDQTATGSVSSTKSRDIQPRVLETRAVVVASQSAAISAELNGRVISIPYSEGMHFKKGDILVEFDCRRIKAELRAVRADAKQQGNKLNSARELQELGSAGTYDVREALFAFEKAEADVANLSAKVETCQIKAPFDGMVSERLISEYEVAGPNQPLLNIIATDTPKLSLVVPSDWLVWLKPESELQITLDETAHTYVASVESVVGAVDPVSQTVRVKAYFNQYNDEVVPGMSGSASFVTSLGEGR